MLTEEIVDVICDKITSGGKLTDIAKELGFPSYAFVYKELHKNPLYEEKYARARVGRADIRSEHIDDYVDKVIIGEITSDVARIAIQAEQWQAARENSKRYGDSTTLKGDKDNPLINIAAAMDSIQAAFNNTKVIETEYNEVSHAHVERAHVPSDNGNAQLLYDNGNALVAADTILDDGSDLV